MISIDPEKFVIKSNTPFWFKHTHTNLEHYASIKHCTRGPSQEIETKNIGRAKTSI